MRPFLLWVAVSDWLSGAMPPPNPIKPSHVPPMGVVDSWVLVGVIVLAVWGSIRLAIWLDLKIRTHALLRELHRELGIGGPSRRGSHRRRQA